MSAAWNLLIQGKIIEAVTGVYTTAFEPVPSMFYAIVVFIGLGLVYAKTENVGTVGITGLLIASSTIAFLPVQVHIIAWDLLALCIALIILGPFIHTNRG